MSKAGALKEQVGGSHYKGMKIEVVEFAHANDLDFFQGTITKHVCRHRDKNGLEDLKKARHYLDIYIQLEYPEDKPEPFVKYNMNGTMVSAKPGGELSAWCESMGFPLWTETPVCARCRKPGHHVSDCPEEGAS